MLSLVFRAQILHSTREAKMTRKMPDKEGDEEDAEDDDKEGDEEDEDEDDEDRLRSMVRCHL